MDELMRAMQAVVLSTGGGFGPDSASALARAAQRGAVTRLRRGAYTATPTAGGTSAGATGTAASAVRAGETAGDGGAVGLKRAGAASASGALDAAGLSAEDARALLLERAVAVLRTRPSALALSHHTAAAAWGMPIAGRWPTRVDVQTVDAAWSRTDAGVRVHRNRVEASELVERAGVLVTSPALTLLDLARSGAVEDALVALDAALGRVWFARKPMVDRDRFLALLGSAASGRGLAMARAVLEFADAASGSPGETCSRLEMYRAGFARPMLQVRHQSTRRQYYETDFEWPKWGVIGEFDGRGKYFKDGDGGVGQAVYEEKLREDELRAAGYRVVRWGWREVRQPHLLRQLLLSAGVPITRRPSRGMGAW